MGDNYLGFVELVVAHLFCNGMLVRRPDLQYWLVSPVSSSLTFPHGKKV
jgi:hypothetical protein